MTSENLQVVLLFAAIFGAAAAFDYASKRIDKKRNAAMQIVAAKLGFSYEERGDPFDFLEQGGGLPVFRHTRSATVRRLMRGTIDDRKVALLDYEYVVGSGKNQRNYRQTILFIPNGARDLPDFTLAPEGFFDRVAKVFGSQDIDFPAFPEFSRKYRLRGADEPTIRRAFNTQAIALLSSLDGWHVQSQTGSVAVFRAGKFADLADMPSYTGEAARIAASLISGV